MAEIIPGVETEVFGYNGQVLGPTIVARFREPIVVRQTNTLDIETSVHLHGGHSLEPPIGRSWRSWDRVRGWTSTSSLPRAATASWPSAHARTEGPASGAATG